LIPSHKDTEFIKQKTLNLGEHLKILDQPLVMAILNLSPDSFYKTPTNKYTPDLEKQIIERIIELRPYCEILDLGAVSTRPGTKGIPIKEEANLLKPVLQILRREFPDLPLSVDTWQSEIAKMAVAEGAVMINDISGGTLDEKMFRTIAGLKVPYVLMHMQGSPETMQIKPHYHDVVNEIKLFFAQRIEELKSLGVNDIILDPGFGFGKTVEHNFLILNKLSSFRVFGLPILAGLSRKSFIQKTLSVPAEEALNGTTVLNTIALLQGADILRVHDPREAKEVVRLLAKGC